MNLTAEELKEIINEDITRKKLLNLLNETHTCKSMIKIIQDSQLNLHEISRLNSPSDTKSNQVNKLSNYGDDLLFILREDITINNIKDIINDVINKEEKLENLKLTKNSKEI
jgi:hypothetical protein